MVILAIAAGIAFWETRSPGSVVLEAVSSAADGDTWAAGWSCSSCGATTATYRTVIMRRHGSSWSQVSSPSPGSAALLRAVSAGPSGSAWAVGWSCYTKCLTSAEKDHALIMRWNGNAWSQVPGPSISNARLYAVTAGPGRTAWAVGVSCASSCGPALAPDRALILRWNGSAWSRVASSSPASAILRSVSTGPGGTAWAVGWYCTARCTGSSAVAGTLTLRWNGSAWSRIPSPTPGIAGGLRTVAAAPDGGAWAAGFSCTARCGTAAPELRTLILRWNGSAWTAIPAPSPGRSAMVSDVQAAPGARAWATGWYCVSSCGSTASEQDRALILRWNGATWSRAASPGTGSTFLTGVSVLPDGTAWAIGGSCSQNCDTTGAVDQPLILRWSNAAWSIARSHSSGG